MAAVIIVIIIVFILAKLFGFGKSNKKDKEDNEPQIEDVLDDEKEDEEKAVEVPDLLGKSYSEAKEVLNERNLGITLGETRASSDYEPGQIIAQSIEKGTEVEPNTTITVDICGDGEEVEVPDVLGYTKERAVSALEELGFTVDVAEAFDSAAAGNVISTSPSAGSKAKRSGVIKVVVSKGPEEDKNEETVPKIEGLREADAKVALSSVNLKSGTVTEEFHNSVAEGYIISQSVKAGTDGNESCFKDA